MHTIKQKFCNQSNTVSSIMPFSSNISRVNRLKTNPITAGRDCRYASNQLWKGLFADVRHFTEGHQFVDNEEMIVKKLGLNAVPKIV